MSPEIRAIIAAECDVSGVGAWSVTIHVGDQLAYRASGSCSSTTETEMQAAAYRAGIGWINDRFPECMPITIVVDGSEVERRIAGEHLSRFTEDMAEAPVSNVWPILMKPGDVIALKDAMDNTGKSDKTLRVWCKTHGIARQSSANAPLEISAPALEMLIHGDMDSLELLRRGERESPRVVRYFRHLGLKP